MHSDVGGGNGNLGLNWITLSWMFENALRHSLPIDLAAVATNAGFKALPRTPKDHDVAVGPHRPFASGDAVHASVEFSAADRQRLLGNPLLAMSVIDDAGALSPMRPSARNANT
ncbi:MAG: hypothetical protein ABIT71_21170 [Vicinamibacteraceae bacterium]